MKAVPRLIRSGLECIVAIQSGEWQSRDPGNPKLPQPDRPAHYARGKQTVASRLDISAKSKMQNAKFVLTAGLQRPLVGVR